MLKLVYQVSTQDETEDEWLVHGNPFSNDYKIRIVNHMVGFALRKIFANEWKRARIVYILGEVMWDNKYGYEFVCPVGAQDYEKFKKESLKLGIPMQGWHDVSNHFHVEPEIMYNGYPTIRGY